MHYSMHACITLSHASHVSITQCTCMHACMHALNSVWLQQSLYYQYQVYLSAFYYLEALMLDFLYRGLKRKIRYTSTPPPHCPFPLLLSRVIRLTVSLFTCLVVGKSSFRMDVLFDVSLQPEVLSMYDWENPDKLMRGREIDLSKSLPKESLCLRMIAEQLTLMEFSVYAVIQRK